MKYLLLSLVVLSTSAMAADAKKSVAATSKTTQSTKGTLDVNPKSKADEVSEDTALTLRPEQVKVDISCKEKGGHELKHGDKGYEECLQKVKEDKKNSHDPKADVKVDFKKK